MTALTFITVTVTGAYTTLWGTTARDLIDRPGGRLEAAHSTCN